MVVAEEASFTKAAARLGVSQSALSHAMRALEERVGLRLLARTTRSVAPTEAGARLLVRLRPAVQDIDAALDDLRTLRSKPSGTVRITTMKHAAEIVLAPALDRFFALYPDIKLEIDVDDALTDIVASRYDAGIRFGMMIDRDMIAVPVSPPLRVSIVGAPSYFARHGRPRRPEDLTQHQCIGFRFRTSGTVYAWELTENGRDVKIKVDGPLIVNDAELMRSAAVAGHGLAYQYDDMVAADLKAGRLERVLRKYCDPFPGYSLYYAGRRQSPALAALIEVIRYRPRQTK